MATFLQAADRMPSLSGSSEKDVKALHDYVYSLQEALRYVLGNLGEENLDSELLESIRQSGKFASEIRQRSDEIMLKVEELGGDVATLEIGVGEIDARVESAEGDISEIQIDVGAIDARVESAEGDISEIRVDVGGISSRVTTAQNRADSAYSEAVDAWWAASSITQTVNDIVLEVVNKTDGAYIRLTSDGVQIGDTDANVTSIVDGVIETKELVAGKVRGETIQIQAPDEYGGMADYGYISKLLDPDSVGALTILGKTGTRIVSLGNVFIGSGFDEWSGGEILGPFITVDYDTKRISLWADNGVYVNGSPI